MMVPQSTEICAAAIDFALGVEDHYDMRQFLRDFQEGALEGWPEFVERIAPFLPQAPAAAAINIDVNAYQADGLEYDKERRR